MDIKRLYISYYNVQRCHITSAQRLCPAIQYVIILLLYYIRLCDKASSPNRNNNLINESVVLQLFIAKAFCNDYNYYR